MEAVLQQQPQIQFIETTSKERIYTFTVALPENSPAYKKAVLNKLDGIPKISTKETTPNKFGRAMLIIKTKPNRYTAQDIFNLSHSISMAMFITLIKQS